MRKPRPLVYSLAEVIITRDETSAHIKYRDADFGATTLAIGEAVQNLTDQEILVLYNETLKAQAELAGSFKWVAVEPPLGSPQIEYHRACDQWSPCGGVLRCLIGDTLEHEEHEPVIQIDDKELSWTEFGKLICSYAGWGMRIEFTPEDATHRRPKLEVRAPGKEG